MILARPLQLLALGLILTITLQLSLPPLDFAKTEKTAGRPLTAPSNASSLAPIKTTRLTPANDDLPFKTIIIDPGHGGDDNGAQISGECSIIEKNYVLYFSERLQRYLENAGFRTILTRSQDENLTLEKRYQVGTSGEPAIFLCIHANASIHPQRHGFEIYLYDFAESIKFTPAFIPLTDTRLDAISNDHNIAAMLVDIHRNIWRDLSFQLAIILEQEIGKRLNQPSNGIFQAPFYVLKNMKGPALLLELGYITNTTECQELKKKQNMLAFMAAINDALTKFRTTFQPPPAIKAAKPPEKR